MIFMEDNPLSPLQTTNKPQAKLTKPLKGSTPDTAITTINKKPERKKILFLLGFGVLIVLITSAIYFSGVEFLKGTTEPKPYPIEANPASSTSDSLEGWETYRNEKYGFSFDYPSNLSLRTDSTPEFAGFLTDPTKNSTQMLVVTVSPNPQDLNLQDFYEQNRSVPYDWEDVSLENKRINSYEAIIRKLKKPCVGLCQDYKTERSFIVSIKGDRFVVSFTVDNRTDPSDTTKDEKWLDQILPTFRFLDGTSRPTEDQLVFITYIGGLCPDGVCKTERIILKDGSSSDPNTIRVNRESLTTLTNLINSTDFEKLRENKFSGTCPTAYDGQEVTYTFYTSHGPEIIASCQTQIDVNHPLFQQLYAIINQ